MHVGETCELTAPPEFGYGKQAHGIVPGDSTIVFVIKCLSFGGTEVVPRPAALPFYPDWTIIRYHARADCLMGSI
jgi:hypothetical protein